MAAHSIVVVPSEGGRIGATLKRSLGDQELLKKHQSRYAFFKMEPDTAPPKLREAMKRVGSDGVVIMDIPRQGTTDEASRGCRWATVLEAAPGPHTPATLGTLLAKHTIDLPTGLTQRRSARLFRKR